MMRVRFGLVLYTTIVVAFGLLIVILLFRPSGLLGKPEVEKI